VRSPRTAGPSGRRKNVEIRLGTALERDESPVAALDATAKRALWVLEAMEFCSHRYGRAAVGSYVVSMASDVDDVLSVLLLAQWAGLADGPDGVLPLDVSPLFESVVSLENAGPIVERLLADPVYRAHLQSRGNRQIAMIGYSDSNKAVGIVASRWLLREAQAAMVEACEAASVDLLVFHGRGGSVSVGGGRTEGLVRSAPPGAIGGRLRVTEQGESVNERYGLRPIAMRSFERSVNAVALAAAGQPTPPVPDPRWQEALTAFAEASRRAYRALVHEDSAFSDYFQSVTPVDVIERMQIGSRPVTRAAGGGIEALRAIPWMFAWSQSRHMLPGWFGVGSGITAVKERFGPELLGEMYARWPFVATLLDDVEVVLAKAGHGHRRVLRPARAAGARTPRGRDPTRIRPRRRARAGRERLRQAARFRAHVAALDPPAQPVRGPHPPDAGGPAAALARVRPRGPRSLRRARRIGERHRAGAAGLGLIASFPC
jgi:phosphoenolpyruvate carboxylase